MALIGPHQSGKTTLSPRFLSPKSPNCFDLENLESLLRLDEPKTALAPLRDLVVIDEVQRRPELFPLLRVLADRRPNPAKFLILGSASHGLLRQSSESLAGRMETIGFQLPEVGITNQQLHWLRGGFPLSYLAKNEKDSLLWRKNFVASFLERDLPSFGVGVAPMAMNRFWSMLAHYHGQTWHGSETANSMNVVAVTTKRYLDTRSWKKSAWSLWLHWLSKNATAPESHVTLNFMRCLSCSFSTFTDPFSDCVGIQADAF